ncbi:hypothetical protein PSPO01_08599 [Paraphaeosphaeria sporulosa]
MHQSNSFAARAVMEMARQLDMAHRDLGPTPRDGGRGRHAAKRTCERSADRRLHVLADVWLSGCRRGLATGRRRVGGRPRRWCETMSESCSRSSQAAQKTQGPRRCTARSTQHTAHSTQPSPAPSVCQ